MTEEFRKRTDATRLLMLLGVVLIHCNILSLIPGGGNPVVVHTVDFFSYGLSSACVPWFFFVSAYLSAYRRDTMDYAAFLRKKARTILVPYLLWNTLAVLIRTAIQFTPAGQFTSGGYHFGSVWQAIVEVYWEPTLVPLWFLRNLFVFILLYPAIKWLVRKSLPLSLAVLLVADNFTPFQGIFYYGAGIGVAYIFSPAGIMSGLDRCRLLAPLYIVTVLVCNLVGFDLFSIPVLRNLVSVIGFVGVWSVWRPAGKAVFVRFAGRPDAIFFVYAVHGIFSPYILRGLARFIPWEGYGWLCCYFLVFAATVAISYSTYYAATRLLPRTTRLLTGGRTPVV